MYHLIYKKGILWNPKQAKQYQINGDDAQFLIRADGHETSEFSIRYCGCVKEKDGVKFDAGLLGAMTQWGINPDSMSVSAILEK